LIDGHKKVAEICLEVQESKTDKLQPPDETEKRITEFLSLLYREKYISFREILSA
jgi:methionine synthase II (cobalamin-independent)